MAAKLLCALCASAALLLVLDVSNAQAGKNRPVGCLNRHQTAPGLFTQYYYPAHCSGGVATQLYLAPYPTPPLVGHTYVTYQPFMPHEYMYKHHRTYYKWHPHGGNFTRVKSIWW
jgi:hypothetical protein